MEIISLYFILFYPLLSFHCIIFVLLMQNICIYYIHLVVSVWVVCVCSFLHCPYLHYIRIYNARMLCMVCVKWKIAFGRKQNQRLIYFLYIQHIGMCGSTAKQSKPLKDWVGMCVRVYACVFDCGAISVRKNRHLYKWTIMWWNWRIDILSSSLFFLFPFLVLAWDLVDCSCVCYILLFFLYRNIVMRLQSVK